MNLQTAIQNSISIVHEPDKPTVGVRLVVDCLLARVRVQGVTKKIDRMRQAELVRLCESKSTLSAAPC